MENTSKVETKDEKKVVYTAKVRTIGGRINGRARSEDGRLEVRLSTPGTSGMGTNPEQLFAAAWSACFEGAMQTGARIMNVRLPDDTSINAEIDLCMTGKAYSLQARLNISIPGMDREMAQKLIEFGHQNCLYSNAIRGNLDVVTTLL